MFGDMAFQLGGEDDVRLRMRMTATDLNMDILTAKKVGSELSKGLARNDFLFSGVSDIKFDIGEQVINGTVDVSKVSIPLVLRLVDFADPEGLDSGLQNLKSALDKTFGSRWVQFFFAEYLGGMKVWIKENLLNQSFVWDRPWIDDFRIDFLQTELPNPVPAVIRTLNVASRELSQGAFQISPASYIPEIRRRNLAEAWDKPVWAKLRMKLKPLAGRVVIE